MIASAFVALTGRAPVTYPNDADRVARLTAIANRDIRTERTDATFAKQLAEILVAPASQRQSLATTLH